MSETLVLVDAQKGFWQNAGKIEEQLQSTLRRAKKLNHNLIVLEYTLRTYGRTHVGLRNIIDTFDKDKVCYMEKRSDDGHAEALEAMDKNGWSLEHGFSICGVNLCFCVAQTAWSLARYTRVELLRQAVACWDWCDCGSDDQDIIRRYEDNGVLINGG